MSPTSILRVVRHIRRAGYLVLLSSIAATAALPAQHPTPRVTAPPLASAAAPLVIRGVTVIDVQTGQPIANQTVVIVGRRIRTLAADTARLPRGARVVDGRGKYLIPGLWDLHHHSSRTADIAHPLLLANGVVGVRDAGSGVPLATLVRWKRQIAAGTRVGPRLLVSGPAITEAIDGQRTVTYLSLGEGRSARHQISVPPALARYAVDSLRAAGADLIKLYTMSRAMELAVVAEARRLGMPFGGHSVVPGPELSDSGATFLDHSVWLSPDDGGLSDICSDTSRTGLDGCRAVAEHLRRNNTWIVAQRLVPATDSPQLDSLMGLEFLPRMARFYPASFRWPFAGTMRQDILASLRRPVPMWDPRWDAALRRIAPHPHPWVRAGLPIVLGSDQGILPVGGPLYFGLGGVGFSAHVLLAHMVLDGMTPAEALQTATLNPARALRATDSLGTVESGKVADLVLLDADPLQAIWNTTKIRAVIANGRYYDRAVLDRLVSSAERAAAAATTPP